MRGRNYVPKHAHARSQFWIRRKEKTEKHEKQHLDTLKRLKRGDENELKRNLRREKVAARPWRQKKKEEQDWRMMQLPNGSGWPWSMETDEERKARLEKKLAMIKGVVYVGVVLSLKPILIKLVTMLIIQTWCYSNIGTHNWKKYRSWIIVCFSHSSIYLCTNLYLIIFIISF